MAKDMGEVQQDHLGPVILIQAEQDPTVLPAVRDQEQAVEVPREVVLEGRRRQQVGTTGEVAVLMVAVEPMAVRAARVQKLERLMVALLPLEVQVEQQQPLTVVPTFQIQPVVYLWDLVAQAVLAAARSE